MQKLIVDGDYHNARVDRFLKEKLGLLNGEICKNLRIKKIKLNKKSVKSNDHLSIGDIVTYHPNLKKMKKNTEFSRDMSQNVMHKIKQSIFFENDEIVAINKPYGFSIQKAKCSDFSAVDALCEIFQQKIYIIHRIDKETSGLVIFAKNKLSARKFCNFFEKKLVKKEYFAVLDGIPRKDHGIITSYITKLNSNESIAVQNDKDGKFSETYFEIIAKNEEKNISFVKFLPKTGRIHQIRLHSKKISNGIIGDSKYNKSSICKLHLVSFSITIQDVLSLKLPKIPDFINKTLQESFTISDINDVL